MGESTNGEPRRLCPVCRRAATSKRPTCGRAACIVEQQKIRAAERKAALLEEALGDAGPLPDNVVPFPGPRRTAAPPPDGKAGDVVAEDAGVKVPTSLRGKDAPPEHRASIAAWPARGIISDGDNHFPIHDPAVTAAKLAFARDVRPSVWVNTGDLLDFWPISRYDKEADRLFSGFGARLQDEIDSARPYVEEMCSIVDEAHLILGNHENRQDRLVDANPSLHGLRAIGWKRLLDYPEKFRIHPYGTILKAGALPLCFVHGDQHVPRGAKYPTHWLLANRINRTTIFGHNHKAAIAFRTGYDADGPVTYGAVNQGHGSLTAEQKYAGPEPDWQHAFTYTEVYRDGGKARFAVHLLLVIDGKFSFNGKVYDGRKAA